MLRKGLTVTMVMLALGIAVSVWGDSTTLSISNSTDTVTSPVSSTLNFPITRTGDTSYDAFLQFQTLDGTAMAGVDYTAASGSVVIPAGQTSATIPVTVAGSLSNQPDKTFQMLLLGGGGAGMGFSPSFAAAQSFATGRGTSVAVADINGDGLPDLIVANSFENSTVSVLLNTTAPGASTPSFASQQTFAAGTDAVSVTVADVNGDGLPDLIVANQFANTVSVLINTTVPGASTPSFASQQTFATGNQPFSVTAADVNGDGKPDLIVANLQDNTVSVLLNTTAPGASTPSFASQQTFATGFSPVSVAAVDVNGDGRPDVIVANQGDSTLSLLLNTTAPGATTPSFASQQTFATGNFPQWVTTADVNGDGRPDLIVANADDNTVSVLINATAPGATTPSFASQQTFAAGSFPISVTAADVNGDGRPDVIVANQNDSTLSVLLNTTAPGATTPSFASQQTYGANQFPFSVTAADINGDGKPDLIVTSGEGDNAVSVLLNTMSAPTTTLDGNSFASHQDIGTGINPTSVKTVDVNGDGKPDLVVSNYHDNTVSVLLSTTAPGATVPSFSAQQNFGTGNNPISMTTTDVNGDGLPDLIVANFGSNTVSVLLNTTAPGAGSPSFASQQSFATGTHPFSVTEADINGDGLPDLIVANQGDNTVSVLLNTTAPGATSPSFATQQTFATGNTPFSVAAVDLNGDGRPDLAVADFNSNTVSVLFNTTPPGATTPSFATQQTFATGINPISVAAADINGDGLPDLIVANNGGNSVSVLLNTTAPGAATPSFASQQTFASGNQPYSVSAADVNGDDRPDLLVTNSGSNTVSVLLNTTVPGATTPSFATQQTFATGTAPVSLTAADLNGDGKPDLIVANDNAASASVLLNTLYAATSSGSPATGTIHYAIPQTTATLSALAFGDVPVGATVTRNMTVKNTGMHPLFVGTVSSNDPEFAPTGETSCPAGGLAHLATCTIAIEFTPSALGVRSGTISVIDNSASSPQHAAAGGTGTINITVTPASGVFGNVKIGSKATKAITVANKQSVAVTLTLPPAFSGANFSDFSRTGGTCTSTLAAKADCTLIVTYIPTQVGTESATMTVTAGPDTFGSTMVSFTTGENIPASLPTALAFGTLTAKTSPKSLDLALTNLSGSSLSVSEGSTTGANSGDFAVTGGTCGASVAAHSICTIAITFTPTLHATAESASIAVTIGNDPTSPHSVKLTGTGP